MFVVKAMLSRIPVWGFLLAAVSTGFLILFGAYEASEKTMPDSLFYALAAIGAVLIGMGIGIPFLIAATRFARARRWRWPSVRKDTPEPHQWLLQVAKEDAENPARHLLTLSQIISNMDLDPKTCRPWVEFGFGLYNGGVHSVLIGPVSGRASYHGNQLVDSAEGEGGKSTKPRGHLHTYKIKQYIPNDIAAAVHEEIAKTHKLRSFSLSGVSIEVQSEISDGAVVRKHFTENDTFLQPD